MKKLIFSQQAIWNNAIFLLRVWVGVIFISHGMSVLHQSKVEDFAKDLQSFDIPLPLLSAWLCKTTEFLGGIFLIIGFLKRPACIFLIIDMAVATFVAGKGELLQEGRTPFILLVCCLTIMLSAQDNLSVDWLVFKKKQKQ